MQISVIWAFDGLLESNPRGNKKDGEGHQWSEEPFHQHIHWEPCKQTNCKFYKITTCLICVCCAFLWLQHFFSLPGIVAIWWALLVPELSGNRHKGNFVTTLTFTDLQWVEYLCHGPTFVHFAWICLHLDGTWQSESKLPHGFQWDL